MRLDVLTALCLALVVAGCVSTPKPFEHDVASDGVLSPRSDKIEVAVGTPANMPDTMAARVAAALALELQAYNIVAAVQPAEAPAKVAGSMSTRDSPNGPGIEIEIEWFLFDGQRFNGPAVSKTHAMTEDYEQASDRLVSRIAQQAAPQIATLLGKPPVYQPAAAAPASAAPQPPQVRVMVAGVTGAPSDGDRQLFSGMRRALGSNKIVVMDKGGADVFVVSATVTLTPIDDRSGQLAVTWILKDPSGKEVGKVEQSNPVPLAAARGSWLGFGDIVATAAVEGVLQLIDKALAQQH